MSKIKFDEESFARMFPSASELRSNELRRQIIAVWQDILLASNWNNPEEVYLNPQTLGSMKLVAHINAVTESALQTARIISKYQDIHFDEDRIIALGLLHDACKLLEEEPDGQGGQRKSLLGKELQHGVIGAFYAREHGLPIELQGQIVSHATASGKQPSTLESVLLVQQDFSDGDVMHLVVNGKTHYL